MDLKDRINTELQNLYKSKSQLIRVLSEKWVKDEIICPNCGESLLKYENNRPVADFYCNKCSEEFELKSKQNSMGRKIVDGAYSTMMKRLKSANNPNFFFLNYDIESYRVINFTVIPKHFIIPELIEARKPLKLTARRSGWQGCNILLSSIPRSGKIFYFKNKIQRSHKDIMDDWKKTLFLREAKSNSLKGWILDVMNSIDMLNKEEFELKELYKMEKYLQSKHPENKHVKDKIRQQLQFLRDKGYLEFKSAGRYRLIK